MLINSNTPATTIQIIANSCIPAIPSEIAVIKFNKVNDCVAKPMIPANKTPPVNKIKTFIIVKAHKSPRVCITFYTDYLRVIFVSYYQSAVTF